MQHECAEKTGEECLMDYAEVRTTLIPKNKSLDEKLNLFRTDRDEWNSRVKKYLTERNEINRQVKELISEVQKQKLVRDEANSSVKELKIIRAEHSDKLKALRAELKEKKPDEKEKFESKKERKRSERQISNDIDSLDNKYQRGAFQDNEKKFERSMKKLYQELKDVKASKMLNKFAGLEADIRAASSLQENSHKTVERAVGTAQEAHDLMIELSEEVDRLRERANTAQEGVIRSKREADALHRKYIVSLRSIHSIQDLLKAMNKHERESEEDGNEKLEINDLMTRLMAGDTLSTEELMALQRN